MPQNTWKYFLFLKIFYIEPNAALVISLILVNSIHSEIDFNKIPEAYFKV